MCDMCVRACVRARAHTYDILKFTTFKIYYKKVFEKLKLNEKVICKFLFCDIYFLKYNDLNVLNYKMIVTCKNQ